MNLKEIYFTLARNMLYIRRQYGLSRKQMAAIAGIGVGGLKQVEAGVLPRSFNGAVLCRLSKHFHVSTDELLFHDLAEGERD